MSVKRCPTLRLPFRSTRGVHALVVMDASENGIIADIQWDAGKRPNGRDKDDSRMFIMGVMAVFGGEPELLEQAINMTAHSDEEAEHIRNMHLDAGSEKPQ